MIWAWFRLAKNMPLVITGDNSSLPPRAEQKVPPSPNDRVTFSDGIIWRALYELHFSQKPWFKYCLCCKGTSYSSTQSLIEVTILNDSCQAVVKSHFLSSVMLLPHTDDGSAPMAVQIGVTWHSQITHDAWRKTLAVHIRVGPHD
jgi:hypothetical protein